MLKERKIVVNKKQKILIVHNYYQVPGGEDTVVENEKNMLIDNGHKVLLYTRHNDDIKDKNILQKLLLPLETIFSLKTYRDIKRIIKKENIDIVHVHNTLPLISPSVYYATIHSKVPVVQTVHNFRLLCPGATFTKKGMICEDCMHKGLICAVKNRCYRESFTQSLISTVNLAFHRAIGTYRKVDGYIALTQFNKEKLKSLINEDKIFIKPNFVDFGYKKSTISDGQKKFLCLGRIDKLKGIDIILKAWKEIKDEELYIVGSGSYEDEAKKFVLDNKMSNVKFLGFKSKYEVRELLENTKGLVIASQCYEGFPMTIVESFALGVPVIAGNIGNLSKIVKNNKNGLLFKYDSYIDLKNKVELLKNEELQEQLSQGAYNSYIEKYNKEINYSELIAIYKTIGENDEGM